MFLTKIRPHLKLISLVALLVVIFAVCLSLMIGSQEEINDLNNEEVSASQQENNDIDLEENESVEETVEAYGFYIDGIFIAACIDDSLINEALETVLDSKSKALGAGNDAKFTNEFEIVKTNFNKSALVTSTQLKTMLGYDKNGYVFEINSVYGKTDLVLNLSYTKTMTQVSEIAFDTIYFDNDGKNKKYNKVLSEGENGSKKDYYEIIYLNDKVVATNLVDSVVVKAPVSEVVERGVMIGSSMTPTSLKIFSVPIEGYITSPYEWRDIGQGWKFHQAIDISGPGIKGKEVIAAGDGEVISINYTWGYGKRVEILHPNGMITTYSHLNSYLVEEGDVVKEGQPIGIVGSTGNSTGVHLHFEVIIDGEKVNPVHYLKETLYEDD